METFDVPKLLKANPIVESIILEYSYDMKYFIMTLFKRRETDSIYEERKNISYHIPTIQLDRVKTREMQNIVLNQAFEKCLKQMEYHK